MEYDNKQYTIPLRRISVVQQLLISCTCKLGRFKAMAVVVGSMNLGTLKFHFF
jgi:hypothetical protein